MVGWLGRAGGFFLFISFFLLSLSFFFFVFYYYFYMNPLEVGWVGLVDFFFAQ